MDKDIEILKNKLEHNRLQIEAYTNESEELEKQIQEIVDNQRFIPKYTDFYWYINIANIPTLTIHENDTFYASCIASFNCFRTEQEAQKEADRILLLRELRQFAKEHNKGWIPDWKDTSSKYGIICHNGFGIANYQAFNAFVGNISFKSQNIAFDALQKFKSRLHILIEN